MKRFFLIVLTNYYIVGQESAQDFCNDKVDKELRHFTNTYQPPSNFTIPNSRDGIEDLLNRLNKIANNLKDLRNVTRLQADIDKNIERIPLQDLKNGTEVLKSIIDKMKGCNKVIFDKLKTNISEIERLGQKVNTSYDYVTVKMNEINSNTMAIKLLVDNITVPETYTCNDKFLKSLEGIILISIQIKEHLKKNITEKLKNLKNKMGIIEKTISDVPGPALIMDDSPDKLRKTIADLKEKIKTEETNFIYVIDWKNIFKKLDRLKKKKDKLKEAYDELKKIVLHLCETEVCEIGRQIKVEVEG